MSFALFTGLPVLCECVCSSFTSLLFSYLCFFNYVYSFSCAKYCVCVLHFAVVVELNMFSEAVSVCCYCFMFYISVTIT